MSNPFSLGAQILETPQQGGPKYHELYIRLVVLTGQEFAIPTGPQGTDPINTIVRDLKLSIGVYSGSVLCLDRVLAMCRSCCRTSCLSLSLTSAPNVGVFRV